MNISTLLNVLPVVGPVVAGPLAAALRFIGPRRARGKRHTVRARSPGLDC